MKTNLKTFLKKRPLSWSAISAFGYNKDEWYKRYILGEKQKPNNAMLFGSAFGRSVEARKPLAPVEIYSETEYPLRTILRGIPLIGFIDTYEPHFKLREYKTAQTVWSKDKAKNHGQLRMYALMLNLIHKVKPEDLTIHLDCIQTQEEWDNREIKFLEPDVIHSFEVKLTMADILVFGGFIENTVEEMQKYCDEQ